MSRSQALFVRSLLAIALLTLVMLPALSVASDNADQETAPGRAMARQAVKSQRHWVTTDHSKLSALQKKFQTGSQITAACVSCHSKAETQFHETIHWQWIGYTDASGKRLGKGGDSINNFCISSNNMQDEKCLHCHTGWKGKKEGVNCLKCHGQKEINWDEAFEDYQAFAGSDDPDEKEMAAEIQTSIQEAAQAVGLPGRKNCGGCHFYGGGGDMVKHGDLDSSMTNPNKALDVHMGTDGQNFQCTRCHTTVLHNVAGRIYSRPAAEGRKSLIEDDLTSKITCESCHSATPHKAGHKANDHTDKVACQSCHIPEFARVLPTKMSWDWSTSGKLKDGKKYKEKGPTGTIDYMTIKGDMHWEKNVKPEYFWWNGSMRTMTIKDKIDPSKVVRVSEPVGTSDDPNSRIYPFKVHRGKQPYDKVRNTMLAPLLSGPNGYWETLDWQDGLTRGMALMKAPYSGQFGFVKTSYVFPTTHMVAPKQNVVACSECHVKSGGRLAAVSGVYMPARDGAGIIDAFGWIMVLGALVSVMLHGAGRFFTNGRKGD